MYDYTAGISETFTKKDTVCDFLFASVDVRSKKKGNNQESNPTPHPQNQKEKKQIHKLLNARERHAW